MYTQILLYFDKHRSVPEFIKYGSRVINKLFNKTMQKLSAELSKAGPRRSPRSPPLISTPDYMYRMFSVHEVTLLLNLPEAISRKFSVQCFCVRPKSLRVILPLVRKLVPGPPIAWVRIETCTACLYSNQNVDKTATMLRFSNVATSAVVEEIDHQLWD